MKRIIVIGCPGSGKTTFSKRLAERCGLPLFHLDAIWHKPDKTHISREKFDMRLGEIIKLAEWIIDGNYSRTLERRIAMADGVFLFDLPIEDCLAGAMARLGEKRCDMPFVDTELDPAFEQEILDFPKKNLPKIYELLEKYGEGRQIVIFKSRKETDEFISGIK
jgi:adenylate kinase family enzyme